MIFSNSEDFRELQACRICSGRFAKDSLPLVATPLANELYESREAALMAQIFPLEVVICEICKHVQLKHIVSPRRLFDNYVYRSGTSFFFQNHFASLAAFISRNISTKRGIVVEVGSNDGCLLEELQKQNLVAVGVEPSEKLVAHSRTSGLNVKHGYLDDETVAAIIEEYGLADVVVGNNVFAHIDDMVSAFQKVCNLLKSEGLFVFEVADFAKLIENGIFDTIYHEHMSYHTATGLLRLLELSNLKAVDVFEIEPHGGSLRFVVARADSSIKVNARVDERLDYESRMEVDKANVFSKINKDIQKRKEELRKLLSRAERNQLIGYGAPAKLVTFSYQMGLEDYQIKYVVDDNELKQGHYIPGLGYEVVSAAKINDLIIGELKSSGLSILLFPWNLSKEILEKVKSWAPKGTLIVRAFPEVLEEPIS